jgi:hypothetical protein
VRITARRFLVTIPPSDGFEIDDWIALAPAQLLQGCYFRHGQEGAVYVVTVPATRGQARVISPWPRIIGKAARGYSLEQQHEQDDIPQQHSTSNNVGKRTHIFSFPLQFADMLAARPYSNNVPGRIHPPCTNSDNLRINILPTA